MWGYNYYGINNESEELMHFKYIRKYRSGGKWRYVYANKKTHEKIRGKLEKSEISQNRAKEYARESDNRLNSDSRRRVYKTVSDSYYGASMAYKRNAENIISQHSVFSISAIGSDKINKGKKAVSKFLKNLFK